jgi:ribosomal protein S14
MFPYYQPPVQQPQPAIQQPAIQQSNKHKNSCSFCGSHRHFIRDCDLIGITLHRFLNTEDKDEAMNLLRAQTNSGLQQLLHLLGCTVKNINKRQMLELIELRWTFFRNSLQDMILKGDVIRDVKTYRISC